MSYGALMRINRDAHKVLGKLVDGAEDHGSPHVAGLRDMHQGSRPYSARETATLHGEERRTARLAQRYIFQDPYAAVSWRR